MSITVPWILQHLASNENETLIDASKLNSISHVQDINIWHVIHYPIMEQNLDHLFTTISINNCKHKMSTEVFNAYYYCISITKRYWSMRNYGFGSNILVNAEIISNNLMNFVWTIHIFTIGESTDKIKQWTNYFLIPVLCLLLLQELSTL